jgi:hypothetical protein
VAIEGLDIVVISKVVAASCELLGLSVKKMHPLYPKTYDLILVCVKLVSKDLVEIPCVNGATGNIAFLVIK